jgi:Uma2 family endonuclease
MNWQELCENPNLRNLPFKIESDATGKLIMSPVKVYHSAYQGAIGALLDRLLGKIVLMECAIKTPQGTKVADVAWASPQRFNYIKQEIECPIAPEICIEVVSDSNTEEEMAKKRQLYFEQGALEVWICSQQGQIRFYNAESQLEKSILAATFPNSIEL